MNNLQLQNIYEAKNEFVQLYSENIFKSKQNIFYSVEANANTTNCKNNKC